MPNVVKGSKQQRMVVVPYRPWFRVYTILAIVALLLSTAAGAYLAGEFVGQREYQVTSADNERLSLALRVAQDELSLVRSELAIAGRSNIVDQRATEEVQSTISSLRERIRQLEQDVSFYRQVMAPESAELGLIVAEFEAAQIEHSNRYQYKLVFRQAGAGDKVLEGSVQVNIIGQIDSSRQVLPLADLVSKTSPFESSLNFRYFQNIEGELQFPEGFVPEQVEILAESTKPRVNKVEKIFSWSVVEV